MIAHYVIPHSGIWFYLYVMVRLAVLAAMLVIAARLRGKGPLEERTQPETPLEILNRRFARGEITWEEYERTLREQHADWRAV